MGKYDNNNIQLSSFRSLLRPVESPLKSTVRTNDNEIEAGAKEAQLVWQSRLLHFIVLAVINLKVVLVDKK